jgi:hypothetical protein
MVIKKIYNMVRVGWGSINIEQKLSLAGIMTGIIMIYYVFCYAFDSKYGLYIAISGYTLAMFCILGYSLFKYFPVFDRSKRKIPQRTINYYVDE